jgi:transglutaminase-like putative cysteine protease
LRLSSFRLNVGCDLRFFPQGAAVVILHLQAMQFPGQRLHQESLRVSAGNAGPDIPFDSYVAPGSANRLLRVVLPATSSLLEIFVAYRAEVVPTPLSHDPLSVTEVPVGEVPFAVQTYLLASRYCQSDLLRPFAESQFGHLLAGHSRVTAICNWIRTNVKYAEGSSDSSTTAHDTLGLRAGVCRDFAHLGIALCRALDIPARFVSAYSPGLYPEDFHALFEVYLAGRWYLFDPTRLAPIDRSVRIGIGRDAMDVSFATIYGDVQTTKPVVYAAVSDEASLADAPDQTVQAITYSDV